MRSLVLASLLAAVAAIATAASEHDAQLASCEMPDQKTLDRLAELEEIIAHVWDDYNNETHRLEEENINKLRIWEEERKFPKVVPRGRMDVAIEESGIAILAGVVFSMLIALMMWLVYGVARLVAPERVHKCIWTVLRCVENTFVGFSVAFLVWMIACVSYHKHPPRG